MSHRVSARRRSIRLPHHDYAGPGRYFVTVCTYHRAPVLGRLERRSVRLTEVGRIVRDCWRAIPAHFAGVEVDAFVVMPDHVHGIIIIRGRGAGAAPAPSDGTSMHVGGGPEAGGVMDR
ncbi:MAG TPA: hypothetical protein VNI61_12005, partial [Gemmatimonadales bacterium]|nr:hypothetical protein [Gemmatimonadales bacterium]